MASRLAVLALLLACVVWGAWLNYVATALVEGEVNIKNGKLCNRMLPVSVNFANSFVDLTAKPSLQDFR